MSPGAILVRGRTIAGVGGRQELRALAPDVAEQALGGTILMPGFVDAHCHLEWALTAGLAPGGEFGDWLGAFLVAVAVAAPGFTAAAADAGALAALRAGTTTLCDSGPTGAGAHAMARLGLQGYSCVEAFGNGSGAMLHPVLERLRGIVDGLRASHPGEVRVGISPHAPYSVGPEFWELLMDDPDLGALRRSTHIAESAAELEAITSGGGTIARALAGRGVRPAVWPGAAGDGVVARMDRARALRPEMIAAHCVQIDASDARRLAESDVRVAHCPTSNAYLGCGVAPLAALRHAGVRVGLGTDSPASAGHYDIRAEARTCAVVQGAAGLALSPRELVRLATLGGAEVLGCEDEVGSLRPGKRANIVALAPAPHVIGADPHVAALDPETRVTHVWIDGVPRLRDGEVRDVDVAAIATRAAEARKSVC